MREFVRDMTIRQLSPATIGARVELLERLRRFLDARIPPVGLLAASSDALRDFQASYAHLAPSSVDVYTRHLKAFYRWACEEREMIGRDPAARLPLPSVPKGLPHPTSPDDLRLVFSCADGGLRIAYVLAAFAGLRRGEICRLHRHDVDTSAPDVVALIHGKGRRERRVPFIGPVMDELYLYGLTSGWVVRRDGAASYVPERLSIDSHYFLTGLGLETTLHSMRHYYATNVGRITKDPMLVRDLCGHQSVSTTEIYMETDLAGAHERLAGFASAAGAVLNRPGSRRLRLAGS